MKTFTADRSWATSGSWAAQGLCASSDAEMFFPDGDTEYTELQTRQAVAICSGCPVRTQCLTFALETEQNTGVWGGLTERQRRHLLRERRLDRAAAA